MAFHGIMKGSFTRCCHMVITCFNTSQSGGLLCFICLTWLNNEDFGLIFDFVPLIITLLIPQQCTIPMHNVALIKPWMDIVGTVNTFCKLQQRLG